MGPDSRALSSRRRKGKGSLYRVELAGGAPEEVWSSGIVLSSRFADGRRV